MSSPPRPAPPERVPRRVRRAARPAGRLPPAALVLLLAVALPACLACAVRFGETAAVPGWREALRGAAAELGLGAPLEDPALQAILALRTWKALTAAGVGAALALSGALVQGVFRNGLASPSVLGITGGASLAATLALVALGGYGPTLVLEDAGALRSGLVAIPLASFAGAFAAGALVHRLATVAGQISIPALLLIGIAVNTFLGGALQLVQSLVLGDWEVSRSILAWTFGTFEGRTAWHAATVGVALAAALAVSPFVAWELDLMQAGLADAQALGVDTVRVRWLALAAAALAASAAVAVAGQIAFVGLVVPHLVRLASGVSHRTLLPLSAASGAVFLLGVDVGQTALFGRAALQPGVAMSLIGGPFFVLLVWRKRRELATW